MTCITTTPYHISYHALRHTVNRTVETYAENSRIPVMSFGTPEEDAMRRDLTINSLFYNIHTQVVEDYSKRGVQDLKAGA